MKASWSGLSLFDLMNRVAGAGLSGAKEAPGFRASTHRSIRNLTLLRLSQIHGNDPIQLTRMVKEVGDKESV